MYTVASPDPDTNPRGGGQLPNPNECNSTLTSGTRGIYPHRYILMLMSGVTAYVFSARIADNPYCTAIFVFFYWNIKFSALTGIRFASFIPSSRTSLDLLGCILEVWSRLP